MFSSFVFSIAILLPASPQNGEDIGKLVEQYANPSGKCLTLDPHRSPFNTLLKGGSRTVQAADTYCLRSEKNSYGEGYARAVTLLPVITELDRKVPGGVVNILRSGKSITLKQACCDWLISVGDRRADLLRSDLARAASLDVTGITFTCDIAREKVGPVLTIRMQNKSPHNITLASPLLGFAVFLRETPPSGAASKPGRMIPHFRDTRRPVTSGMALSLRPGESATEELSVKEIAQVAGPGTSIWTLVYSDEQANRDLKALGLVSAVGSRDICDLVVQGSTVQLKSHYTKSP